METLQELFEFFDKNGDGVISKPELIELVEVLFQERGLGKSNIFLREFDENQNGVIEFDEFKRLCAEHLNLYS